MKKIPSFLSLLLVLALLCALLPSALADFSVEAGAAIVMELKTGAVLYEQDADSVIYPASLTKIMTALVAVENCDPDELITVHADTLASLDPASSTANLADGEQLSLRQLLYCMFLVSANDASCVVAEHVGGSMEQFVQMMNTKAAELGCEHTHFANPHGLHDPDHYTTARDLLKITEAFCSSAMLLDIADTESYYIPATDHNREHSLYTIIYTGHNNIAPGYCYEGCRGIKTGTTTAAGRCLIVTCDRNGMQVIAVVTGCPTEVPWQGGTWYGNYAAMHQLLDYCYLNFTLEELQALYSEEIAARAAAHALQKLPESPAEEPQPDSEPAPPPASPAPAEPPEEETPNSQPPAVKADSLPWYGWLLIGLAALLTLYAAFYIIWNLTRPKRRKRRNSR